MSPRDLRRAEAALALAIGRMGSAAALAEALGVSRAAISQWPVCPPARVLDVETITGVSRYDLRPDYYPDHGGRDGESY